MLTIYCYYANLLTQMIQRKIAGDEARKVTNVENFLKYSFNCLMSDCFAVFMSTKWNLYKGKKWILNDCWNKFLLHFAFNGNFCVEVSLMSGRFLWFKKFDILFCTILFAKEVLAICLNESIQLPFRNLYLRKLETLLLSENIIYWLEWVIIVLF